MSQPYLPSRWLISAANLSDDPDTFPLLAGQSFLTRKAPTFNTAIATATSGRERRRQVWSYPRWKFAVAYEFIRDYPGAPEIAKLRAFFNAHGGRYQQFFYNDPSDNSVTGQSIGTGDGVTTTFQLTRSITIGNISYTEPVRGVSGTPTIAVNGAATTAYTIGAYGSITFTTAPPLGQAITWTGTFLFVCRFDQDELDAAQMVQQLWSQSGLSFISVKR